MGSGATLRKIVGEQVLARVPAGLADPLRSRAAAGRLRRASLRANRRGEIAGQLPALLEEVNEALVKRDTAITSRMLKGMPEEFARGFGLPPITDEIKRSILGGAAAKLLGISPVKKRP